MEPELTGLGLVSETIHRESIVSGVGVSEVGDKVVLLLFWLDVNFHGCKLPSGKIDKMALFII